jgi:hypothetical protein
MRCPWLRVWHTHKKGKISALVHLLLIPLTYEDTEPCGATRAAKKKKSQRPRIFTMQSHYRERGHFPEFVPVSTAEK